MKIKCLLTHTAALAVCMSCAVAAFAGPADGKILKQTAALYKDKGKKLVNLAEVAAITAPRMARGTIQHFRFSPGYKAAVRAGIESGKLERKVNAEVLQYSPVPAPVVLGASPVDVSFSLHHLVSAVPFEKEVLAAQTAEEKFYEPEIAAAQRLHSLVSSTRNLDAETATEILSIILHDIKNHSLQTYLLKSLAAQDLYMLDLDLKEYFSLNMPVEIAAFNYTLRHPHQQILMMRRLLHNPLVDEDKKAVFRSFLTKSHLRPDEFSTFRAAISDMYSQYTERVAAATESDVIQTQVRYYGKLLDRLGDFIAMHGRRPKWNTTDLEEEQLFNEIEWVQLSAKRNNFEPLVSYQHALNMVWKSVPAVHLTKEDTVALFDDFVRVTRKCYPRSLRAALAPGEQFFPREEELWDSLFYWRVQDSSIIDDLQAVYAKYNR